MQTAAQINLPQTGQVELPPVVPAAPEFPFTAQPGCKELPLETVCVWQPHTTPPAKEFPGAVYCVSVPKSKLGHELAHFRDGQWWSLNGGVNLTGAVTFWCELPYSPEYMAAHPEEFTDKAES